MKKFYVYVHTCKANGKRYVGCTTKRKPEYRWVEGRGYRGQPFEEAIRKHGWDNFEHEVFEVDSKEEMYRKEIELISFYHSNDPRYGYNSSIGGEKGGLGSRHSEESRKKHSEAAKKEWLDPEIRRKKCESQKKVHSDPEYRKKISEAAKKRCSDPEYRRKMSEAGKKSHADPEVRRKMSLAKKGKPRSEETKRRVSEALKGRPKPKIKISLPDGTIIKISKSNLTRYYINKGKKFEYVS